MEIKNYVDSLKKLQSLLLIYVENSDNVDVSFDDLINYVNDQLNQGSKEDMEHFLNLISNLIKNHHRVPDFFIKIEKILKYYTSLIKQTLTNYEIYEIFKKNKKILLFLIESSIINFDEKIVLSIIYDQEIEGQNYCHFFYPEIKNMIDKQQSENIEKELLEYDSTIFDHFNEKRYLGENEKYLCEIIRKDSYDEFIIYLNKTNISFQSIINKSIFETNSYLLKQKKTTLIEYAAFYGSIQIFKYLHLNKVKLEPSIWKYAIHSNNAELFNYIEENFKEEINYKIYEELLCESIKCHHNEIADYIHENLITEIKDDTNNIVFNSIRYDNYSYFPTDFKGQKKFVYLCRYKYYKIIDILMNDLPNKNNINKDDLKNVGDEYNVELVYYLLSKQDKIHKNQFQNCSKMEIICIPPSIKEICQCAFRKCKSLKEVIIPSSVTNIKSAAFSICIDLTKIKIPYSVEKISNLVFNGCKSLTKVIIPPFIKIIKSNFFSNCSSFTKITILPLTEIKSYFFFGCTKLEEIAIPSSVTSIGDSAFRKCSSLKQITIPSSVTSIENFAFCGCSSLTQITLPSSVIKIGSSAFCGCSSLTQITLPSSVTKIGSSAFSLCINLTQITIPSSVTSIGGGAFYYCTSLVEITIPSSVKKIEKSLLAGCCSLTQFIIPPSIISIGSLAMSGCSKLKKITIPPSVTVIEPQAFNGCSSLTQITIPSSVTEIGNWAFENCSRLKQISIPFSAKYNYLGLSKVNITRY